MKKLFTLWIVILITLSVFAQSSQKLSYQAVIRNSSNALVTSHVIGMRISILRASASGTVSYTETQTPTTNVNGLVSIEIGGGTGFDTIHWANGPYYIKTETDPTGGTSYTITGTSQLLSVPYAFYAKTASTHYIGESYGGGIVFYVYDNGQHGLIAAITDQSLQMQWYNGTNRYTGATGDGLGAGARNTAIIISAQMNDNQTGNFAAKICADYSVTVNDVTYGDWYLPSKYELNLLYLNQAVVAGFAGAYFSSTEYADTNAWYQDASSGNQGPSSKAGKGQIRAIRAF